MPTTCRTIQQPSIGMPLTCCRVAMWLVFSDVWNAIVEELRSVDLLSEGEKRNLSFVHLPIDDSIQVRLPSMSALLVLLLFWYQGQTAAPCPSCKVQAESSDTLSQVHDDN